MKAIQVAPAQMVAVAIGAGLVAAFHMGKIPAALPGLESFFNLSLTQSGLVVSSFSLLAAVLGIGLGLFAGRLGPWLAGVTGLVTVGCGSALGAMATSYPGLLGSRIIEGLGFVLVAVTMPGLINRICPPRHRAIALGIWGAFIPAAMSLMLVTSPAILHASSWQGLWLITAVLSLAWAIVFGISCRSVRTTAIRSGILHRLRQLASPLPAWTTAAFVCYSAMFAAVTAFLPSYWIVQQSLSHTQASLMASLVVIGNIVGNIIAGYLVSRGATLGKISIVALLTGGIFAGLVFAGILPVPLQFIAAAGFTLLAGMLPGAVFASIDKVAPGTGSIPLMTGMIFQGAGIGQVLGPVGLSLSVSSGDSWAWASVFVVVLGLAGAICGGFITRLKPQD